LSIPSVVEAMRAHAPAVLIRLCCFRVSCINLAFTILCPLSIFLFFSGTNEAVKFKKKMVEYLMRAVVEVRAWWLIHEHRFAGCVIVNLFGATHDRVTSPVQGFSGRSTGAAALDMRTEKGPNGVTIFMGTMHVGTHLAHPDPRWTNRGRARVGDMKCGSNSS
jgi:hypothetical protein